MQVTTYFKSEGFTYLFMLFHCTLLMVMIGFHLKPKVVHVMNIWGKYCDVGMFAVNKGMLANVPVFATVTYDPSGIFMPLL